MSAAQNTPLLEARVFPPSEEPAEIAEEFAELFGELGIAIPPLPRACLPALERVDAQAFASMDMPPLWLYNPAPFTAPFAADTEAQDTAAQAAKTHEQPTLLAAASAATSGTRPVAASAAGEGSGESGPAPARAFGSCPGLFVCGLRGHGVQSWNFHYIFSASRLHCSVVLPLGNAYNDPEREKADLAAAFDCIEACLHSTQGGTFFAGHEQAELFWDLNAQGTRFVLRTLHGAVLAQGDTLEALLDFFQTCLDAAADPDKAGNWLAV